QRETAGAVLAHSIHDYLSSHPRMSKYDYKTVQEFSLFGDPALVIGGQGGCSLSKPLPGYLYLFDKQLMPTLRGRTVILGGITVQAAVGTEVLSVEFYVDGELMYTDHQEPFAWTWDERAWGRHTLSIVGSGPAGSTEQSLDVIIFNL
ncbi:MAG: Ig-like domain-containing protein, partial [Candidatus Thermoplasmatota archaeon]|nr:Ig-like domain-containing protein [Candidatus Thermoplasmatota archaeon]